MAEDRYVATRAHVLIRGVVQGVGFRWYTARRARELGVTGWVRNLPDGRVEAVFEGDRRAVQAAVDWCSTGPRGASVTDVRLAWDDPEGLAGFEVRY